MTCRGVNSGRPRHSRISSSAKPSWRSDMICCSRATSSAAYSLCPASVRCDGASSPTSSYQCSVRTETPLRFASSPTFQSEATCWFLLFVRDGAHEREDRTLRYVSCKCRDGIVEIVSVNSEMHERDSQCFRHAPITERRQWQRAVAFAELRAVGI